MLEDIRQLEKQNTYSNAYIIQGLVVQKEIPEER